MNIKDCPVYQRWSKPTLSKVYEGADIIWDGSNEELLILLAYFPDKGFGYRACSYSVLTERSLLKNMQYEENINDMIEYLSERVSTEEMDTLSERLAMWLIKHNYTIIDGKLETGNWEE